MGKNHASQYANFGSLHMFLGKNSNSVNGFVGVSIPLGGRKASKEG